MEAAKTLLDYGFANFCVYSTEGGSAGLIPVTGGVAPTAEAYYGKSLCCFTERGRIKT